MSRNVGLSFGFELKIPVKRIYDDTDDIDDTLEINMSYVLF